MKQTENSIVVMTREQQQKLIELAVRKVLQDYNLQCNSHEPGTRLLSAKETQNMLGCSATTLWRLGKQPSGGLYPVHLAPHKIAYRLDDIEDYINKKTNKKKF